VRDVISAANPPLEGAWYAVCVTAWTIWEGMASVWMISLEPDFLIEGSGEA